MLVRIRESGLDDAQLDAILGDNAARLLRLLIRGRSPPLGSGEHHNESPCNSAGAFVFAIE